MKTTPPPIKKKKSIELHTSGKPTKIIWILNSMFTLPCIVEVGARKWTINGFVCKFIYKNTHQVVYFTDLLTYTCYKYKICICAWTYVPHPLCMVLRSTDNIKMPYFCELYMMTQFSGCCSYCGNKDSLNVTQGVTQVTQEPPQQLFSYFFSLQCAGTAGWRRSLRPPSFFCHCSACWGWHFTADLGILKKKRR